MSNFSLCYSADKAISIFILYSEHKIDSMGSRSMGKNKNPGSVRTNSNLVEAFCDENQTATMIVCLAPVEKEREHMKNSYLS